MTTYNLKSAKQIANFIRLQLGIEWNPGCKLRFAKKAGGVRTCHSTEMLCDKHN